jgi:hypothetical protein
LPATPRKATAGFSWRSKKGSSELGKVRQNYTKSAPLYNLREQKLGYFWVGLSRLEVAFFKKK